MAPREEDKPGRELEGMAREAGASCKVVADSQCSLEQWDREADRCQSPSEWADPWVGPLADCDDLHDLFQHQTAGEVTSVEEDAWAPPTAAEDHLAVVAAGRAGHRVAERGHHRQGPAVVAEHMEAVVAAAACKYAEHSWDGSSAEAEQAGRGVAAGVGVEAVRDRATAAGVVGSQLVHGVGVVQEGSGSGAGGRMAVVPAEVAVEGSRTVRRSGSQVWHPIVGDLLCLYQHVHHGLLHSGTSDIGGSRSWAEPGEGREVVGRSYTPCRRVLCSSRFGSVGTIAWSFACLLVRGEVVR